VKSHRLTNRRRPASCGKDRRLRSTAPPVATNFQFVDLTHVVPRCHQHRASTSVRTTPHRQLTSNARTRFHAQSPTGGKPLAVQPARGSAQRGRTLLDLRSRQPAPHAASAAER
jgi:hypothetical protein